VHDEVCKDSCQVILLRMTHHQFDARVHVAWELTISSYGKLLTPQLNSVIIEWIEYIRSDIDYLKNRRNISRKAV
jgi:hypothetical protein